MQAYASAELTPLAPEFRQRPSSIAGAGDAGARRVRGDGAARRYRESFIAARVSRSSRLLMTMTLRSWLAASCLT